MPGPRILTFNFHEPYLCLMAKTGFDFTIGLYKDAPLARQWQTHYRPMPANMTPMDEPQWREALAAGAFDVVIAHNESNAIDIYRARTPKILVCHNRRTFLRTTVKANRANAKELYDELLAHLRERVRFVFISESKRDDYGVPGDVILPGIDVEEFGGYTGEVAEVLRVGNMMRSRDLMFDVDLQERVCEGIPNSVVGVNPDIPGAREAQSFEELLNFYRTRRCLLHVTREAYEDGYNLAMLEAMACGMPVVSLANATSPLTDGVDGLVAADADGLRAHIQSLLDDPQRARELGARGRETVAATFSMSAFVDKWRHVIEETAEVSVRRRTAKAAQDQAEASRAATSVLLQYVASPLTTGRYFERAIRKRYKTVTAGLRCPEEVLELWGFTSPPPPYAPHDVDLPLNASAADVMSRLPEGFAPDVYFWLDSGPSKVPDALEKVNAFKVCYLIDTHVALDLRLEMARHFDVVFLAQKAHVKVFQDAGIANVFWLPLACSPGLHLATHGERIYDVAFVGSVGGEHNARREKLLRRVKERFPNSVIGQFWPDEMARIYAQSKIVVNVSANRDVNMRVFEAMASGALLVTDEADGLEDLFVDGEHLVVYRNDDDLIGVIERYLEDLPPSVPPYTGGRLEIAAAGQALVLETHTYDRRVEEAFLKIDEARGIKDQGRFGRGGYYRQTRPELAQHVPVSCQRLLDVGCGGGDFAAALKQSGVKEAHGIEIVEAAWKLAKEKLDSCLLGDIEQMELPFDDGYFDCITCGDVLEHLREPAAALRKLARVLRDDGIIIMSLPNVRYYGVLEMLGAGRWQYADAGILDRTHLRFFTAIEMRGLIEEAGLETLMIAPLSTMPRSEITLNADGSFTMGNVTIKLASESDLNDLLTYQYLVIAGKPGVDRLTRARLALEARDDQAAYILATEAKGVDDVERMKMMATAAARMGRLTEAEELYEEVLKARPDDLDAIGQYGILLVGMNRIDDAHAHLDKVVRSGSPNERVIGTLGLVHMTQGRLDEAFECLKKAVGTSYDSLPLVEHLVAVAAELNRLEETVTLVREYADFYPGNIELGCLFAGLLIDLEEWEEARERLETITLFAPHHEKALALLARVEEQGGSTS